MYVCYVCYWILRYKVRFKEIKLMFEWNNFVLVFGFCLVLGWLFFCWLCNGFVCSCWLCFFFCWLVVLGEIIVCSCCNVFYLKEKKFVLILGYIYIYLYKVMMDIIIIMLWMIFIW